MIFGQDEDETAPHNALLASLGAAKPAQSPTAAPATGVAPNIGAILGKSATNGAALKQGLGFNPNIGNGGATSSNDSNGQPVQTPTSTSTAKGANGTSADSNQPDAGGALQGGAGISQAANNSGAVPAGQGMPGASGSAYNTGDTALASAGGDVTGNQIANGTGFMAGQSSGQAIGANVSKGMGLAGGMTTATSAGAQAAAPDQQAALAASLASEAAGGGPVQQASRAQLQTGTDQAIATQMALAASQQGGNPMLAYRNAQNNAATLQQQNANAAAGLTATNAMGAQGQLANVTGQIQQNNQFNAGAAMSNDQFNATQTNATQQQQQQLYAQYIAAGMNADQALYQSQQQAVEYAAGTNEQTFGINQNVGVQNAAQTAQIVGSVAGALGGAIGGIASSDENAKKNISDGEEELSQMLSKVGDPTANEMSKVSGQTQGGFKLNIDPKIWQALGKSLGNKDPVVEDKPQAQTDTVGSSFDGTSSDERKKKNVKDGGEDVKALLLSIHPNIYEYKDPRAPGAGDGKFVSPMAQELEKSAIGANMVHDTPNGKMVDYQKAAGAMLAALAAHERRIDDIEDDKPAPKGGRAASLRASLGKQRDARG